MISFEKLWDKADELGVSQYKMHEEGISNSTITRLKRNQHVNTESIDKLCHLLHCKVEDIMEYIDNE